MQRFLVGGVMVLAMMALVCVGRVKADTLTLTGTVRDFHASHPDFEAAIGGVELGIVTSTLGGDKKPVYANISSVSTSNAANFNQWYTNVVGVNLSTSLPIVLDNTITGDPNVFTFEDSSFFPIDGQLFGNEGNTHNFHFTYELHSQFTYQGGEVFSFTGDDDLWVFIDDQLAVDVGGVHPAASGSVDLDTLGLTLGQPYDFDLFFAERHTTQSNFRIDTSIVLQQSTPTPEPSTMLLLSTGLVGLVGYGWRRKQQESA